MPALTKTTEAFGDALIARRKLKFSQKEFADKIGYSASYLSHMENVKPVSDWSLDFLKKYVHALGFTLLLSLRGRDS